MSSSSSSRAKPSQPMLESPAFPAKPLESVKKLLRNSNKSIPSLAKMGTFMNTMRNKNLFLSGKKNTVVLLGTLLMLLKIFHASTKNPIMMTPPFSGGGRVGSQNSWTRMGG